MIEKVYVVCPFCLKNTGRWKLITGNYQWYDMKKTWKYFEANNVTEANLFERSVLKEHVNSDNCLENLSKSVIQHYKLV